MELTLALPPGAALKLEQGAALEDVAAQLQNFTDKVLCVVDGKALRFCDAYPGALRYDHKQRRGGAQVFYFRDVHTDALWCVFGREAARRLYKGFDELEPADVPGGPSRAARGSARRPIIQRVQLPAGAPGDTIVVVDGGVRLEFPNPPRRVEAREIPLHRAGPAAPGSPL